MQAGRGLVVGQRGKCVAGRMPDTHQSLIWCKGPEWAAGDSGSSPCLAQPPCFFLPCRCFLGNMLSACPRHGRGAGQVGRGESVTASM